MEESKSSDESISLTIESINKQLKKTRNKNERIGLPGQLLPTRILEKLEKGRSFTENERLSLCAFKEDFMMKLRNLQMLPTNQHLYSFQQEALMNILKFLTVQQSPTGLESTTFLSHPRAESLEAFCGAGKSIIQASLILNHDVWSAFSENQFFIIYLTGQLNLNDQFCEKNFKSFNFQEKFHLNSKLWRLIQCHVNLLDGRNSKKLDLNSFLVQRVIITTPSTMQNRMLQMDRQSVGLILADEVDSTGFADVGVSQDKAYFSQIAAYFHTAKVLATSATLTNSKDSPSSVFNIPRPIYQIRYGSLAKEKVDALLHFYKLFLTRDNGTVVASSTNWKNAFLRGPVINEHLNWALNHFKKDLTQKRQNQSRLKLCMFISYRNDHLVQEEPELKNKEGWRIKDKYPLYECKLDNKNFVSWYESMGKHLPENDYTHAAIQQLCQTNSVKLITYDAKSKKKPEEIEVEINSAMEMNEFVAVSFKRILSRGFDFSPIKYIFCGRSQELSADLQLYGRGVRVHRGDSDLAAQIYLSNVVPSQSESFDQFCQLQLSSMEEKKLVSVENIILTTSSINAEEEERLNYEIQAQEVDESLQSIRNKCPFRISYTSSGNTITQVVTSVNFYHDSHKVPRFSVHGFKTPKDLSDSELWGINSRCLGNSFKLVSYHASDDSYRSMSTLFPFEIRKAWRKNEFKRLEIQNFNLLPMKISDEKHVQGFAYI